jgi:ABC-type lipoprotein export system ATPase subunit
VICDEPTSFLDSRRAESVCELLRGEADRGRSVLVATHDPLVVDFADKAVPLAEHG